MEVERATCVAPATCVALPGGVLEVELSMEDLVRYQEVFSMRREYVYCASMVVLMQLGFTFLEVNCN